MATIEQIQVGNTTYDIAESGYAISNQYSTTEKVVGTWVDGKPIHQITVNFTVAAKKAYDLNYLNIDKLINMQGTFTNGGYTLLLGGFYGSSYYASIAMTSDKWIYMNVAGYSGSPATLTLWYTKTTD